MLFRSKRHDEKGDTRKARCAFFLFFVFSLYESPAAPELHLISIDSIGPLNETKAAARWRQLSASGDGAAMARRSAHRPPSGAVRKCGSASPAFRNGARISRVSGPFLGARVRNDGHSNEAAASRRPPSAALASRLSTDIGQSKWPDRFRLFDTLAGLGVFIFFSFFAFSFCYFSFVFLSVRSLAHMS